MSGNPVVAQAILSAAAPLLEAFNAKAAILAENDAKAATETVKVADLTAAMDKSDDKAVIKAKADIVKAQEILAAAQKSIREARNAAQVILFPNSVVADTMPDDERKALIAEAAELRKNIVSIFNSAKATDPDVILPELAAVVGQRGRPAGFKSSTEGKPKPRVSAITLDGKNVEPKPTFGNLSKSIKATTNVAVANDVLVDKFFEALGSTDWQSDANKGKTVEFTLVVDTETNRSVTVSVTV